MQYRDFNHETTFTLGLVLPFENRIMADFAESFAPPGVRIHTARVPGLDPLTVDDIPPFDDGSYRAAKNYIWRERPCCVGFGIIPFTADAGHIDDAVIEETEIEGLAKRVTTSFRAVGRALAVLKSRKVALICPHSRSLLRIQTTVLAFSHAVALGCNDWEVTPEALYTATRRITKSDCDTVLITGLNVPSHEIIQSIESETQTNVVTSTQALLWHTMRLGGVRATIPRLGRLFS